MNLRYFNRGTRDEFACKCGCGGGLQNMDEETLFMLDEARHRAGIPFSINSGYRCPKHNAGVRSTSMNHIEGRAVDIRCYNSITRRTLIKALQEVGFERLGFHADFIHADTMDQDSRYYSPQCYWIY